MKDMDNLKLADNHHVAVIGAGTMGCGIAAGFLAGGCDVSLLVRDSARVEATRIATLALVPGAASRRALCVCPVEVFDNWGNLDLVIESIPEVLAEKRQLFARLDGLVPADVPIGSNSSSYPISRIASGLQGRRRMFGTHYFMPAEIVPLVEVVLGADSDLELAERVCAIFSATGKRPVLVKRDIPGFLANRIQHALMREALALVDSGIASAEDVDLAVRFSFGFRYAAIGPILQKEISGWDSMANAAREIYPTLCNSATLATCVERLLREGKTGMKNGAGFMTWTEQAARDVRDGYERRLLLAMNLLQ